MTVVPRREILAAMAEENVKVVRDAYEIAYASRSVDRVRDGFAKDFVWHNRPHFPGRTEYPVEEMPQLWADLDETYSEYRLEPVAFAEHGEYVLVELETSARLRDSDTKVEETVWHLWRVVDGVPREGWARGSRDEALEIIEGSREERPA